MRRELRSGFCRWGRPRPSSSFQIFPGARCGRRSVGAGAAGGEFLPRALVPVLRDGAGGMAGSVSWAAGARRAGGGDFAANPAAERLHGEPAWDSVSAAGDAGCAVAEKFGLVWTAPEYLRRYYRGILLNIPFVNGDESWRLPLPATYVIDQGGKVVFAEANADFRVRPEPEDVLSSLPAFARSE